jgi:hypothetical protein
MQQTEYTIDAGILAAAIVNDALLNSRAEAEMQERHDVYEDLDQDTIDDMVRTDWESRMLDRYGAGWGTN